MFSINDREIRQLTLTEYPHPDKVKTLWKHPHVYCHQREALKNYSESVVDGSTVIKYSMKGEFGRYYVSNPWIMSSTTMPSRGRASLYSDTEYDLDIRGCHYSILFDIIDDVSTYSCKYIKIVKYSPEKFVSGISILEIAIERYNSIENKNYTIKDFVKSLLIILLYGGTLQTWTKEYSLGDSDFKIIDNELYSGLISEIKEICNMINIDRRFKDIIKYTKDLKGEDYKKSHGMSLILQDFERKIMEKVMILINEDGGTITSYCYDGCTVLKDGWNTDETLLPSRIGEISGESFPRIEFIKKPFKTPFCFDLISEECADFYQPEFEMLKDYTWRKEYFERFFFLSLNPICYVRQNSDDTLQYIPSHALKAGYGCLRAEYFKDEKNGPQMYSFLAKWMVDPECRKYDKIDYYPQPLVVPRAHFNAWTPWAILKTSPETGGDTRIFYDHFDVVSNHDPLVKEYLLNWFASILQYPANKTGVCIILYGVEGAGKSCLVEHLFQSIIGSKKMMITSDTGKSFGKFSDLTGISLCLLNEASGKDTFDISDILKDKITCESVLLEKKGIDIITTNNFTNFAFTTNNPNPVKMPKDDRRFLAVTVSSEKANDKEYHYRLRTASRHLPTARRFYDEMMVRDVSKWNAITDRPITEMGEDMKSVGAEPVEYYYEYIISGDCKAFTQGDKIRKKELYDHFCVWWVEEGRKADYRPPRVKFATQFKNVLPNRKWDRDARGHFYTFPENNKLD